MDRPLNPRQVERITKRRLVREHLHANGSESIQRAPALRLTGSGGVVLPTAVAEDAAASSSTAAGVAPAEETVSISHAAAELSPGPATTSAIDGAAAAGLDPDMLLDLHGPLGAWYPPYCHYYAPPPAYYPQSYYGDAMRRYD